MRVKLASELITLFSKTVSLSPDLRRRYYNTTLRAIIPLPDPNAHPTSAAHLNAYQEFPAGSVVMALYPDTSCFYRAEVIASPKDMQPVGRVGKSNFCPN